MALLTNNTRLKFSCLIALSLIAAVLISYFVWLYFSNESVLLRCDIFYAGEKNYDEEVTPWYEIWIYSNSTYKLIIHHNNYIERRPPGNEPLAREPDAVISKKLNLYEYWQIYNFIEKSKYPYPYYYLSQLPRDGYNAADITIKGDNRDSYGGIIFFKSINDEVNDEYYYLHALLRRLVKYSPVPIEMQMKNKSKHGKDKGTVLVLDATSKMGCLF